MTYTKQTYTIKSAPKPYLFIGSKIRGAFGYALKEEVCINPTFECKNCFATKECLFFKFYEVQNQTPDYRLDYKLYSDKYKFSLLLFNEAQKEKDVVYKAMMASLTEYKEVAFKCKAYYLTTKESKEKIFDNYKLYKQGKF